jgi:hypothetical protein
MYSANPIGASLLFAKVMSKGNVGSLPRVPIVCRTGRAAGIRMLRSRLSSQTIPREARIGFSAGARAPPASLIRNRDCRRTFFQKWLDVDMTEPLPLLIDSSIEIAWDYLNRTGELGDAMLAGRFLSDTIELMVRRGERRRLMLANKAIAAYQQFRRQQSVPPVLASA